MMPADRARRSTQLLTAVVAAAVAVTLGGGAAYAPTPPSATRSSAAAPAASPVVSSSKSGTAGSSAATGAAGTTTLTGTVTEGVESGCLVLTDDAGAVLANLMGLDTQAAPIGSTVEVTGEFEDLMTTCQQGKPFTVTAVQVQK